MYSACDNAELHLSILDPKFVGLRLFASLCFCAKTDNPIYSFKWSQAFSVISTSPFFCCAKHNVMGSFPCLTTIKSNNIRLWFWIFKLFGLVLSIFSTFFKSRQPAYLTTENTGLRMHRGTGRLMRVNRPSCLLNPARAYLAVFIVYFSPLTLWWSIHASISDWSL